MAKWTCSECGATGTKRTVRECRNELEKHIGEYHNDPRF
jgi:hypothetical protein